MHDGFNDDFDQENTGIKAGGAAANLNKIKENNQKNKQIRKMVQAIQDRSKSSSMYGEQPKSLLIHWMKHDVTDENVHPQWNKP